MPTGERAHALYARSTKAHGATAVLVHGYTDNATSMLMIARIYNRYMNYNILLPTFTLTVKATAMTFRWDGRTAST